MADKQRVLIIGLDGVPYGMIKDLAEAGVMPNMAKLISQSVFKKMTSSIPEVSSVAWSSMITGTNPGRHGVFGFMDLQPNSYKMKLKVKALANLRHYLPDKEEDIEIEATDNVNINEIFNILKIPHSEIWKAVINNTLVSNEHIPKDNDTIEIFPILAGG